MPPASSLLTARILATAAVAHAHRAAPACADLNQTFLLHADDILPSQFFLLHTSSPPLGTTTASHIELLLDFLLRFDDAGVISLELWSASMQASPFPDPMDQAAAALAALAFLLAKSTNDSRLHFHYWFSERIRSWLPSWIEAAHGQARSRDRDLLTILRRDMQDLVTFGINLRGRSKLDFIAAAKGLFDDKAWSSRHRSVLGWLGMATAAASYAGADLPLAFDVCGRMTEQSCETAALLGLLVGAFNGESRLRQSEFRSGSLISALDRGRELAES